MLGAVSRDPAILQKISTLRIFLYLSFWLKLVDCTRIEMLNYKSVYNRPKCQAFYFKLSTALFYYFPFSSL